VGLGIEWSTRWGGPLDGGLRYWWPVGILICLMFMYLLDRGVGTLRWRLHLPACNTAIVFVTLALRYLHFVQRPCVDETLESPCQMPGKQEGPREIYGASDF
jgi:hypothetical protein